MIISNPAIYRRGLTHLSDRLSPCQRLFQDFQSSAILFVHQAVQLIDDRRKQLEGEQSGVSHNVRIIMRLQRGATVASAIVEISNLAIAHRFDVGIYRQNDARNTLATFGSILPAE